ncbi:MAG: hypothetical protein GY869_04715 [Planctomycetes bacterium]|nr:hypothetical protein [Planctomycetota bacterium]
MSWLSAWFRRNFCASNTPSVLPTRITSAELRRQIQRVCPSAVKIDTPDATYALPEKHWVYGGFYNWYVKVLHGLGVSYRKNFDCDNFAGLFFELAGACHGRTKRDVAEGIAIGKIKYCVKGDIAQAHAINIIVTGGGVWFIEPNGGEELVLSRVELHSVYAISFY